VGLWLASRRATQSTFVLRSSWFGGVFTLLAAQPAPLKLPRPAPRRPLRPADDGHTAAAKPERRPVRVCLCHLLLCCRRPLLCLRQLLLHLLTLCLDALELLGCIFAFGELLLHARAQERQVGHIVADRRPQLVEGARVINKAVHAHALVALGRCVR
jgi:hypothetical protein